MKIEVDTGSRLDQSGDTTFAFSNDIQKSILLKQSIRDECLNKLTGRKLSRELRIFSSAIYFLIKNHIEDLNEIKIDNEYPGHQGEIKRYLANLIRVYHPFTKFREEYIRIVSISKRSLAHKIAWKTFRKEIKIDFILNAQDILNLLLK